MSLRPCVLNRKLIPTSILNTSFMKIYSHLFLLLFTFTFLLPLSGVAQSIDNIEALQFEEYPECYIFGLSGNALINEVACFASAYMEVQK